MAYMVVEIPNSLDWKSTRLAIALELYVRVAKSSESSVLNDNSVVRSLMALEDKLSTVVPGTSVMWSWLG